MSELSKQALKVENNTSFPNNNAGLITPTNLRTFNEDMIDSTVNQATYTADSGSWNTQIGESVTTASLSGSNIVFEKGNGDTFDISIAGGTVPPGTISGSAQVIAALPTGTISGSSQVIASLPSGTVSGSSQLTSSYDTRYALSGSAPNINTGSFATTGSNTFTGDQTIQSGGDKNGIFYKTGSSEFFVGQRSNGNFAISSSANDRIIDINPSSGWIEVYSNQTNFNNQVAFRGNVEARNISTTTGLGFVAQFDGFTASLQEGYAWVGKSGGTSVSVPTSSFAGVAPVGTATTGSNTFNGNQTITGSLSVNGSEYITGGNKLYIQRDTAGAQQYLRLGATDNTYNFAFIVTGSDTNPGQQVWGINTAGGTWANSFDAGVVFNSYVTASNGIRIGDSGTFSAPLQQGYVWVGDANGRTTTAPTSSFGGGGTINTGSFATTGSNTFNGNQIITGSLGVTGEISTDSRMYVFNQYGGIDIQQNAQGSGSQYPGMSMKVAPNTYPTDIFGGFTVLTEQGALAGATYLGMVANSYTPQYGGTTVPMIVANGNNPGGNDTAMIWKSDGTAEHWKKSDFKYGVDVTGSLNISGSTTITGSVKLTPASVSTNASYPIPFISGSTISKDSVDTLVYNPSTNQLIVSASTGQSQISPNAIIFTSGSGAFATYASTISKAQIQSAIEGGGVIGISGNPSKIGAPSLTTSTRPGIIALSGSGVPYVAIELENSASFTDGRVTIKRPLVVEGSITGSTTINGSTTITGSLNQTTGPNVLNGATTINNNFIVSGNLDTRNGNSTFNGNLTVSGAHLYVNGIGDDAVQITNGSLSVQSGIKSNGQVNVLSGAGISIQANLNGSGSAYSIGTAMVDNNTDPTNVYSAWQLVDATTQDALAIAWNSYTPRYATSTAMLASPGQYGGSDVAFGFPSAKIDTWKPINFKAAATFTTGSNQQAGTATLDGGNPGTVTVSNSLVTANSIIMLTKQSLGNTHSVAVTAKSAGSFTITSTGNGDSDVVGWFIINNS